MKLTFGHFVVNRLDWYARRFVETHVDFLYLTGYPIPRTIRPQSLWRSIVQLSGRLSLPDERFKDWAEIAVGVDYGLLDPDDKQDKIHEFDAVVAHLYGLSEPQLVHILRRSMRGGIMRRA